MKKTLFAVAAAAVLAASPALAADLARAPMYTKAPPMPQAVPSWTGFYIGADVGGLWTHGNAAWTGLPSAAAFGVNPTSGGTDASSVVAGVHAGYNYQFAPVWVAGLEGDWSWTHARGSNAQPWTVFGTGAVVPGAATSMSSTLNWLSSIRGRLGYLVTPQLMAYATGGAAWGDVHYGASATNPVTTYAATTSLNRTADGFVVGGGLEWALNKNWSLRGEYLFYHLYSSEGVVAAGTPVAFAGFPSSFTWSNTNIGEARGGISYKF